MKKLIILLSFLLPFFLSGQIVQNTEYNQGSYCMSTDNNRIDFGSKVTGQTPINLKCKIYLNSYNAYPTIFSCGGYASSVKGFTIRTDAFGNIVIFSSNGTSVGSESGILQLQLNTWYNIEFDWSGLVANDAIMTINGIDYSVSIDYDWIGSSTLNLYFGYYATGTYMDANAYDVRYSINGGTEHIYPLSSNYKAYDISSNGNHRNITGSNIFTTCTENTYNATNGMTKVVYGANTVLVPYLLDGTSQYSAVSPVLNASEKTVEYPASYWGKKIVTNNGKIIKQ